MSTNNGAWKRGESATLLAGMLIHGAQVAPALSEGSGTSIIWLPLHLAPFGLLYLQGRTQLRSVNADPGQVHLAGIVSGIVTLATGCVAYKASIDSRSLLSPLGLLLTPVALCLAAPLLRAAISASEKRNASR